MKKFLLLLTITFTVNVISLKAFSDNTISADATRSDSTRLAELDRYWANLEKTVEEGDFEGYRAAYHDDAVIVFAAGTNKTSVTIDQAMAYWKKGFNDTKAGKRKDLVEFRLSQRIGNETTAHETGIFHFTTAGSDGKINGEYLTHFEMLLIKRDGKWYATMEYQKSDATQEEWDALK